MTITAPSHDPATYADPDRHPGAACPALAAAAAPLTVGVTFLIASVVPGEQRRINVSAPPVKPGTVLPVLYMPDGGIDEDFLHLAGLLQVGAGDGSSRAFLLVGIENTGRRRDLTAPTVSASASASDRAIALRFGASQRLRQFLRTELMPQIARRYAVTVAGVKGAAGAARCLAPTAISPCQHGLKTRRTSATMAPARGGGDGFTGSAQSAQPGRRGAGGWAGYLAAPAATSARLAAASARFTASATSCNFSSAACCASRLALWAAARAASAVLRSDSAWLLNVVSVTSAAATCAWAFCAS